MSGYFGWSKSRNAAAAESDGEFPATHIAKELGIPAGFVKEECGFARAGWHHTSKHFNCTNYFDLAEIAEWLGTEEGKAALAEWRAKEAAKSETRHAGCTVTYLEWSGTRNHPKAHEVTITADVIDRGGAMLEIVPATGASFRKGRKTNGLWIKTAAGKVIVDNVLRRVR